MTVSKRKERVANQINRVCILRCLRLAYPDKPAQRRLAYHVYLISERIKNSRIQVITALLTKIAVITPDALCY
jgi:hypothetical protein